MINSIHRRGGKDVNDFSMTVQDAIEYGGSHFYLFPTRVWAEDAIFKEQFEVNGVVKPFWEWAIPSGIKAQKRDKDCCIIFPHNGARIQLGGTDDLSFVGRGGKSYTMSEFSLHKENVTGFIAPILRQSDAGFRANGTLRGKNNQLYRMLMANMNSEEWHVQWLKPEQTKAYCWISDDFNINPELVSKIGQRSSNGGKIFNVQDDIDSGMISMALARQEYLNRAESQVEGSYYAHEMNLARGEGRIGEIEAGSDRVYTFWDLGGASEKSDETVVVFAVEHQDKLQIIDFYANTGHKLDHYISVLNARGYNYAGHYAPHDAKKQFLFGDLITKARELGLEFKRVPKTNDVLSDIEICRRKWADIEIHEPMCREFIAKLEEYHEKNGRPVHDSNSHYADAFRTMCMAKHLNLLSDYLSPLRVKFNLPDAVGEAESYVEQQDDTGNDIPLWMRPI